MVEQSANQEHGTMLFFFDPKTDRCGVFMLLLFPSPCDHFIELILRLEMSEQGCNQLWQAGFQQLPFSLTSLNEQPQQ